MPHTLQELAQMIADRDSISYNEGLIAVRDCEEALLEAFTAGNIDMADDILREELGLEPDYLMLFIN